MPTATRLTREESAARTRRRVLEAARTVFAERGFHGASLEAMAETAGLTKGAVYAHFTSKADLFLALQEERNADTLDFVRAAAAGIDTPEQAARVLSDYWARRLRDGREWTLLLIEFWATACRDADVLERFRDQHDRLMVALAAALPAAGELLVRATTAIGHGLALEHLLTPEKVDAQMHDLAFALVRETS
jgi:AcrR family transcriptional regulator